MTSLSLALTLFLILNICKASLISSNSVVSASNLTSFRIWLFSLIKHTEIVSAFLCPTDKKGLQHFLGILNFYRRFLQGVARLLYPLNKALKGKPSALTWNLEINQSFEATKSILANVPTLVHPDPFARISLSVDASGYHVGLVLQQKVFNS